MSDITPDRLAQLTTEALERTAFVLTEPAEGQAGVAFRHAAKINYTGPLAGELHLAASDGFLKELAASLLGVEPDEVNVTEHGIDAIKELANIVGGSVVIELGGATEPIRLGLPETAAPDCTDSCGGCTCELDSCGERLRVCWRNAA